MQYEKYPVDKFLLPIAFHQIIVKSKCHQELFELLACAVPPLNSSLGFLISEVKVEVKTEDNAEAIREGEQDNHGTEREHGQDAPAQAEEVKVEGDKGGHQSRKRPYEENRSYGSYYEHREEKRYALYKLWYLELGLLADAFCQHNSTILQK